MNSRLFRVVSLCIAVVCCTSPFVLQMLGDKGPSGVRIIPVRYIAVPALLGGALIVATLLDIWKNGRNGRWVWLLLLGPVGLAIYWYKHLAGQNEPNETHHRTTA